MIYTVTVNPALDYVIQLEKFNNGDISRSNNCNFFAGGKGINVSQILNQINVENTAWGFVGGFTGKELVRQLNTKRIVSDFVKISDLTRVNVKIHAKSESEINASGPKIFPKEIEAFKMRLEDLTSEDIVVLSGSLAPSLPADFYKQLLPTIVEKGASFAVDTTGKALLETIPYKPLVIKPNHHELADLFDIKIESKEQLFECAKKLLDMGAQNVIVSMASEGGYLITSDHIYHGIPAVGKVVNSVGAGDSMLAGFVGTYTMTKDVIESFKVGMVCGAATAFTEDIAIKEQIDAIYPQIGVETII